MMMIITNLLILTSSSCKNKVARILTTTNLIANTLLISLLLAMSLSVEQRNEMSNTSAAAIAAKWQSVSERALTKATYI